MTFYLEKAIFINRAPFNHLELDFKEKGINVLSAVNGRGKTTILSYITDAFYELAKLCFSGEFSDKKGQYYRISSPLFNLDSNKPSIVYLRFRNNETNIDYIDIRHNCSSEEYDVGVNIENKIPYDILSSRLQNQVVIKYWHLGKKIAKEVILPIFENNIITSFPSYRYESPAYINDPYKIKLSFKKTLYFSGYLPNPIEVISNLESLANWVMDIVLDYQIYNSSSALQLRNSFNQILSKTLSSKITEKCRIGIGPRNNAGSRISIVQDKTNNTIEEICPTIFNISSGEAAMLCIFGELLHQADRIGKLMNVSGIVLIDEVDKHLHIKLQKEILPKLFNLFPNVQFIVSSHSPFLNMGLADEALERAQIFNLDNNGIVCSPQNNPLYTEVYDLMINENNHFYKQYKNIQNELKKLNKPIIITEGKTDIIHILKAKEKLKIQTDFKTISEDNQPNGDSNLQLLLEQLSKIEHHNKIIAIFDRDLPNTVKTMDNNGVGYKFYGNNVYGFCISSPQCRKDNNQEDISIEYLYTDDEIHSILPNKCKLFFGNEFSNKSGRHHTDKNLILSNQSDRGKYKIIENNGGQAVLDLNDNNILAKKIDFANAVTNEDIVISQNSWENFRHIFEKIEQIIQL